MPGLKYLFKHSSIILKHNLLVSASKAQRPLRAPEPLLGGSAQLQVAQVLGHVLVLDAQGFELFGGLDPGVGYLALSSLFKYFLSFPLLYHLHILKLPLLLHLSPLQLLLFLQHLALDLPIGDCAPLRVSFFHQRRFEHASEIADDALSIIFQVFFPRD